jgi:hypothetical protein
MKQGKIWDAWRDSTGEERMNFVIDLCKLYKPLIRRILTKMEKGAAEK